MTDATTLTSASNEAEGLLRALVEADGKRKPVEGEHIGAWLQARNYIEQLDLAAAAYRAQEPEGDR
jgi:hypothetical protein